MRVALDGRVASDHFPGIGRVAIELGRALVALPQEPGAEPVDFVFLAPPAGSSLRLGALPAPAPVSAHGPFSPAQQWSVPRALARAGADVYHSLFYLMPLAAGRPTVLTCHDLIPLVRPETQPAWKRALFAAGYRAAIARAEALVAISESTRHDVCARFGVEPARVVVIPLAAGARFAPAAADDVAASRARFGLAGPYLLYVGSNKPHKNLVRLVEAFAAVAEHRPELLLVVAGVWDPRYPEARAAAVDRGVVARVRFLGPVDDDALPALLGGALGFVFPSLYEGFGLPVLEAMQCGVPVVAGATSSLPEVVGDAGLLVDPLDVDALAGAIDRVVADEGLRADLSRLGIARAATFSWERAARAHVDLYRSVARR